VNNFSTRFSLRISRDRRVIYDVTGNAKILATTEAVIKAPTWLS